jgi:glutamine synthetase
LRLLCRDLPLRDLAARGKYTLEITTIIAKINGGIMKKTCPVIASERSYVIEKEKFVPVSEYYGEDTFNLKVLKVKLPRETYKKIIEAINEGTVLDIETANIVAHAMKEWALGKGATHFAH